MVGTLRRLDLTSHSPTEYADCGSLSIDSPRVYLSTNPWKITATFQAVSSTRDEYVLLLQKIKDTAPSEPSRGEKRSKLETAHLAVVKSLEGRLEVIDNELAVSKTNDASMFGATLRLASCSTAASLVWYCAAHMTYSSSQRIQRAQKKIQQRNMLIASAELRETRTRRRTTRPDYSYMNNAASDVSAVSSISKTSTDGILLLRMM